MSLLSFKGLVKLQFCLFILLLLLWNAFVPVLEGADESGHYCSADYIAHRNKIPNLTINDGCFIWHPPLFYLTLAPVVKIFNITEFNNSFIQANPQGSFLRRGQYSQFIHNKDELLFRWNRFELLIHVLRLIPSVFGMLIFLLTYKSATKVFKKKININIALLLFFNPMFLHIFSTLTNVTLLSFITGSFIMIEIIYSKLEKPYGMSFLQGALLGLGYLTKINILALFLPYGIIFLYRLYKIEKGRLQQLIEIILIATGFFLTAGWYIIRGIKLYGTLLELNVITQLSGPQHHDLLLQRVGYINYFNSIFTTFFRTFWSGYGALTVRFPDILNVILLIFILLTLYTVLTKYRELNIRLKVCFLYAASVIFAQVLMNFRLAAMHAKDLFTAYIPISLLFSFGFLKIKAILSEKKLELKDVIIILLSIYFYAQVQIVNLIKSVSHYYVASNIHINGLSITEDLSVLAIKIITTIVIYRLIIFIISNLSFNYRGVYLAAVSLFLVNIFIIGISSYLFYFKY